MLSGCCTQRTSSSLTLQTGFASATLLLSVVAGQPSGLGFRVYRVLQNADSSASLVEVQRVLTPLIFSLSPVGHFSNVRYIMDSTPLGDCFRTFKGSYIHMLVAVHLKHTGTGTSVDFQGLDSNALLQAERVVSGVITLEDVLEEVIQAEIVDESDNFMNNDQKTRIGTNKGNTDMASFLGMIHNCYRDMRPQLSDSVSRKAHQDPKPFVPLQLDRRMRSSFAVLRHCSVSSTVAFV